MSDEHSQPIRTQRVDSSATTGVVADDEAVAHLSSILDTVVDAIVTIDETGMIRLANRAAEAIFGYSSTELLGQNVSMLMPDPDRSRHDGYLRNYLATGDAKIIGFGRKVIGRRKNGLPVAVELAVSEVRVGERRLFTGVLRDLTERNRAAAALQEERRFVDRLLETAHAIVMVLDPDGKISRFNSYLEQISGFDEAQVRGADWFDTFLPEHDRGRARGQFESILSGTPVDGNVNAIVTRSGRQRLIAWSACRLTDAHGQTTGVLAIGNDITALKAAEEKLIQNERLAAIGQMVTGLAHESRNALQRAKAALEMLQLDLPPQSENSKFIRQISAALDELRRLYEEVRAYAAPIHLDCRACNLDELSRVAWDDLASQREGKHIRFRVSAHPVTTTACHCDRERILQVLRNILENAIAVAPDRSEIEVQIVTSKLRGRPALKAKVVDQGPGLSPDQQARVFEPFYTTKSKGTGLGMAIVERVIDAHGGHVSIQNRESERGVEVEFVLPQG